MRYYIITALLATAVLADATVIFNNITRIVDKNIGFLQYDLDGNGSYDLGFRSTSGSYPALLVTGPESTAIAEAIHPLWGGRVAALDRGQSIDSFENRPIFGYTQLSPGANFLLSTLPPDDPSPGDYAPFYRKTAYLGFSFEGDDGLHYGYALVEEVGITAAFIRNVAYESDPDTAIITGAVPEPSGSALMLLFCAGIIWKRSR